jgi:hypothetical protein
MHIQRALLRVVLHSAAHHFFLRTGATSIHTYIYTHIYTHTHTHMYILNLEQYVYSVLDLVRTRFPLCSSYHLCLRMNTRLSLARSLSSVQANSAPCPPTSILPLSISLSLSRARARSGSLGGSVETAYLFF